MQINTSSLNISSSTNQFDISAADKPKGPPPPPPGSTPPGLEPAVATLSEDEQTQVSDMLSSLTKEQQVELKNALDELKPLTEDLSAKDIGSVFLETLVQISSQSDQQESVGIDTYA
ncbi:hypothetical protein L2737_10435 [Shewanella electrodiphila]|uniref:Uncharacterized protein n=1 Tax=Shewanella electrodiphila TaxID=934143 RepID=A0ABT0KQT7_9GAMM|nr:hypothetical protein [Shewanella electrodiphila]MCL1045740.1 hypothetical protein [Shewanella electrodiphila]